MNCSAEGASFRSRRCLARRTRSAQHDAGSQGSLQTPKTPAQPTVDTPSFPGYDQRSHKKEQPDVTPRFRRWECERTYRSLRNRTTLDGSGGALNRRESIGPALGSLGGPVPEVAVSA